ncbi:putative protocadherin-15 precursor [Brachionus plicatilis]|uniref:Putative protocadherin-15 n=1 Tax=Brachionus plicatilis TaxID=10195 RepID=A0A3M7QBP6_BRAPC|nr:putative protocadherin-15 precursor [Brachionus plicatilis]
MKPNDLKGHRVVNNDPWVILIVLACLIIVATVVSIIIICVLWSRYRNSRIIFDESMNTMTYNIPTINITQCQKLPEYEVQSLDMYVPSDDKEDMSEYTKREVHLMQSQLPDNRQITYNGLDLEDKLNLKESSFYRRVMNYTKLYNYNSNRS